jgi:hypothetical protein
LAEEEGALARVRISAVLHPAVLLAPADRAGLEQQGDCPSPQRADRGLRSFVISIQIAPARDESFGPVNRSGC